MGAAFSNDPPVQPTAASKKKDNGAEWNNFKHIDAGMDKWGKERLKLATFMRDNVMDKLNVPWILDNGTLLGAWRDNGTFIKHDDDFDIALLVDNELLEESDDWKVDESTHTNCQERRKNMIKYGNNLLAKVKSLLKNSDYDARLVSSYTIKIEVFDASKGKYTLVNPRYDGADFHYVTFDLQFYVETVNCRNNCHGKCYTSTYTAWPRDVCYKAKDMFPVSQIILENEQFNAPSDCKNLLKTIYGSLSKNAKFNDKTCLYYDPNEKE